MLLLSIKTQFIDISWKWQQFKKEFFFENGHRVDMISIIMCLNLTGILKYWTSFTAANICILIFITAVYKQPELSVSALLAALLLKLYKSKVLYIETGSKNSIFYTINIRNIFIWNTYTGIIILKAYFLLF